MTTDGGFMTAEGSTMTLEGGTVTLEGGNFGERHSYFGTTIFKESLCTPWVHYDQGVTSIGVRNDLQAPAATAPGAPPPEPARPCCTHCNYFYPSPGAL